MGSEAHENVRIFFKDKANEFKGPFTERQVQEWYRKNWFENSFPFYFMKSDELPNDDTEFHTLDSLRSLNGIGCPFKQIDEESSWDRMKEKLARLEKELEDLSNQCDEVKKLEKRINDVEKRLETLFAAHSVAESAEQVSIETQSDEEFEQDVDKLGDFVANTVLYAFVLFERGDFENWKKKKLDDFVPIDLIREMGAVDNFYKRLEQVLVEKLKMKRETPAVVSSGIRNFRTLLNLITNLPMTWLEHDKATEFERIVRNGGYIVNARTSANVLVGLRPTMNFLSNFDEKYKRIFRESGDVNLESDMGRTAIAELHEHIGEAQTFCMECNAHTGDREEFYSHLLSYVHIENLAKIGMYFDFLTAIVNMHRRDLIEEGPRRE